MVNIETTAVVNINYVWRTHHKRIDQLLQLLYFLFQLIVQKNIRSFGAVII